MRDFSWQYFANSGDVDAYLLYKEMFEKEEDVLLVEDELILEELMDS